MPQSLVYFHLIPLAGFLSDSAVLIFLFFLPADRRYRTAFIMGYLGIASWNFLSFLNFVSFSGGSNRLLYYFYFSFVLFTPIGFLLYSLQLTHRSRHLIRYSMAVLGSLALFCLVLLNLWFFVPGFETAFLKGIRVTPWGQAPVLAWGGNIFHIVFYGALAAGFFYLFTGGADSLSFHSRATIWLFACNALASLSNLAVFEGFNRVPPVGNGVDAIVSAILAALLFQEHYQRRFARIMLRVAGVLAAIGITLVITWLFAEFVLTHRDDGNNLLIVALLASLFALIVFQILFAPASVAQGESFEPIYEALRKQYRLTHQEAMICRYISESKERKEILDVLNISGNTLKVQLTSVYRKTIDRNYVSANGKKSPTNRNKFVQLSVFLSGMKDSRRISCEAGAN